MKRAFVPLLSLLLVPLSAHAGVISPGDTVSLNSSDFAGPSGTLLAEKVTSFTVNYGADQAVGFDGNLNGHLRSAVYEVGGKLAFFYDVDLDQANFVGSAAERSELSVEAFEGFTTTVSGMLDFEEIIQASRSADGRKVVLFSDTPGLGGPPALLIQTNALAYDENGMVSFFAGDEIMTTDGTRQAAGSTMIDSVYQPKSFDGGTGNQGGEQPTAIPLPPAAYSGLGVLLAMGLVMGYRRWLRGAVLA